LNDLCLITGNHPRHQYFARRLISTGKVSSLIVQQREEFLPRPPDGLTRDLVRLFKHHFNERERVENEVFRDEFDPIYAPDAVSVLDVNSETLNGPETVRFLRRHQPSLIISYGCGKLSDIVIRNTTAKFWNMHGGLSPDYRGVATHFWPSYFLEPQMTGVTLHETTNFLDAGKVIFQTAAPMVSGDTLHGLAARNVKGFCDELAMKLAGLNFENLPSGVVQSGYGKVFMAKDWRPEHLHLIYSVYDDAVVDACLNGEIKGRSPDLVSTF